LFTEASDWYMSAENFGQITDPVTLLKLKTYSGTANTTPIAPITNDPYAVGMGGWFGNLYFGGYYAFDAYTAGLLGSNQSVVQTQNDTLTTDSSGTTITGKSSVVSTSAYYQTVSRNDPSLLVGFKLGDAKIGIKNTFSNYSAGLTGTFDNSGALATGTVNKILDTAGTVSYLNSTEYSLGTKANGSTISDTLEAGLSMPLGSMALRAGFAIGLGSTDSTSSFAVEQKIAQAGNGYSSYTPSYALPGATASAIDNATSWSLKTADFKSAPFAVSPGLEGSIDIPFSLSQNDALFTPGLAYSLGLNTYSASLVDETGKALSVNGYGSYSHDAFYTAALQTNGYIKTSSVDTRAYSASTVGQDLTHTISLPLALRVTPGADMRFGFSVTPTLVLGTKQTSVAGKSVSTTIVDNGNGIAAASDSGDSTKVVTTTDQPYTDSIAKTKFSVATSAGAQIYFIPKKFRLNLGAAATTTLVNRTEETIAYTGLYTQSTASTVAGVTTTTVNSTAATATTTGNEFVRTVSDATSTTAVAYDAGLTYYFSPNVVFDFKVSNGNAFNLVSTTDNGGFLNLNNYSIQLTIKLPPSAK
jgi:hypothetical protein